MEKKQKNLAREISRISPKDDSFYEVCITLTIDIIKIV